MHHIHQCSFVTRAVTNGRMFECEWNVNNIQICFWHSNSLNINYMYLNWADKIKVKLDLSNKVFSWISECNAAANQLTYFFGSCWRLHWAIAVLRVVASETWARGKLCGCTEPRRAFLGILPILIVYWLFLPCVMFVISLINIYEWTSARLWCNMFGDYNRCLHIDTCKCDLAHIILNNLESSKFGN